MPTAAFSNILSSPRDLPIRRALSEYSTSSMNVDLGPTSQRPRNGNGLDQASTDKVVEWISNLVDERERTSVSMDRQNPDSTIAEADNPFIARRFFGPQYTFCRPTLKRKVSYHGHRDEDPGTPEPSRAAMRRDMKAILAGEYSLPTPRKRVKLPLRPHRNSALNVVPTRTPVIIDLEAEDQVPAPAALSALPTVPAPATLSASPTVPAPAPEIIAVPLPLPQTPSPPPGSIPTLAPVLIPALADPVLISSPPPVVPPTPGSALSINPTVPIETSIDLPDNPGPSSPPPTPTKTRKARSRQHKAATRPRGRPGPKPKPVTVLEDIDIPEAITEVAEETGPVIQNSTFLAMPTEVRNRIYRHLLVSKSPIHVNQLWSQKARTKTLRSIRRRGAAPGKLFETETETETKIYTKVLLLCRQAHTEGSRILYGENRFHYILRDPKQAAALGSSPFRAGPSSSRTGVAEINFAKYCNLFRHMSVEVEPNRTGDDYAELLWRALEFLSVVDGPTSLSRVNPSASPIFLDTLTVTITPVREGTGRQKDEVPKAIKFFSKSSKALKSLQRINTRLIRVNVHVDRPRKDGEESDDETDNDESNDEREDEAAIIRSKGPANRRHLETTIDLRFCARFMDQTNITHIRNPYHDELSPFDEHVPEFITVYPDEMWKTDAHILAKRSMLGQRADDALAGLEGRLLAAWKNADKAVREGLWEDHAVAEQRRRMNRARFENTFASDALLFGNKKKADGKGKGKAVDGEYESGDEDDSDSSIDTDTDDEDSDSEGGGSDDGSDQAFGGRHQQPRTPTKSLIITIGKDIIGGFRAFRAN